MKVHQPLLGVACVLLATSALADPNPTPTRNIPAYTLPTPTTVSPEMRAVLESTKTADSPRSTATTNAGWAALYRQDIEDSQSIAQKMIDHFKLTVSHETIAGVDCYVITPSKEKVREGRLLMNLHGGGYVLGAGEAGAFEAILVAGITGIKTISVDYRMPPEHPFPAPVDDAMAVWKHIASSSKDLKLGLFGSSTGGAMVLAVTQRAIAEHIRMPDAIFAGTPWSDLSETGDSYYTNKYADLVMYDGELAVMAKQYANGLDLKDPRLSPVYGSFAGFPPTLLITGTRDLFLSNTVRVDRKLRDAGVKHELIVYEGQQHGVFLSGIDVPEGVVALKDISTFFDKNL